MNLLPRERDKLLLFSAGLLAERRKARGVKLNYPESVAYISAAINARKSPLSTSALWVRPTNVPGRSAR